MGLNYLILSGTNSTGEGAKLERKSLETEAISTPSTEISTASGSGSEKIKPFSQWWYIGD